MRIPMRCAHCGTGLDAWDHTYQLWGLCADCQAWEAWLWRPCQAQLVDLADAALRYWITDAIAAAFRPYQGGKAV
jgi:hypothetical protein